MKKVPGYDVFIDDDGVTYRFTRTNKGVPRTSKGMPTGKLFQVRMSEDKDGYLVFSCETDQGDKTKLHYHRAKALAFIPNPEHLPTVDHINRDKLDNRLCNLRWANIKTQTLNQNRTIEAFERNGVHRSDDRRAYDRVKYSQRVEQGFRYRTVDGRRGWVYVGA